MAQGGAIDGPGLLNVFLIWCAAVGLALLVLNLLFPRLQRRDHGGDGQAAQLPVDDRPPRLQPGSRADIPPIIIQETRAVTQLSATQRAGYWRGNLRLIGLLLLIWLGCAFVPALLAPWLNTRTILTGFPLGYYMGAQGAPLIFLALTLLYTWRTGRRDQRFGGQLSGDDTLRSQFSRYLGSFTLLLILVTALLVLLELRFALPASIISWTFIGLTIGVYAVLGLRNRAETLDDYYVAGRRIPALFNGLAISADWMSAATFISLAGYLWLLGYEGLAYILGWTGGYVLLALLLAPYLRKFGQYTIPDLIGVRFRSNAARMTAAVMAIIVSFTYLTAQVWGIGIIMSLFLGVRFILGVAIGLGAVLFCSYLGGMKAVSWTQVIQGIILILAYLVPVTWLSLRATGVPLPQLMYGAALQQIDQLEALQHITRSYIAPYNDWSVWNFVAIAACLMCGTAGLPHILIRFYTAPTVHQARRSVSWALVFITLIYLTIPAYAAFSRLEILRNVVGKRVAPIIENGKIVTTVLGDSGEPLPWVRNYTTTGLLTIADAPDMGGNGDGILQFSELRIDSDLVVLAMPDIAGLPHTIGALVVAGGLAAALSTADGLLVVITSAAAHDIYFAGLNRRASVRTQLRVGRAVLLLVAVLASLTALRRLDIIVKLVAWAFSLAASTIFPALVLAIFWKRANKYGAVAGMISGLTVVISYIALNTLNPAINLLGIGSLGAGIFGMPTNFLVTILVSKLTPPPPPETQLLTDALHRP
jgi:cation/acetate symporter